MIFTKKSVELFFFIVPFCIWVLIFSINAETNFIVPSFQVIRYVCVFMILVGLVCSNIKLGIKDLVFALLFILVILPVALRSKSSWLLDTFIFIYASRSFNYKRVLKGFFLVQLTYLLLMIILSKIGLIPNLTFKRYGILRFSLGFRFTSFPAQLGFYLSLVYIFLKNGKLKWFDYIGIVIFNGYLFIQTDTKDPFIIILLGLIINLLKYNRKIKKIFYCISNYCFLLFSFIIYIVCRFYPLFGLSSFWYQFNQLVTNRLILEYNALISYKIPLLGQYIIFNGSNTLYSILNLKYNFVDSSYIQYLIVYGSVFLIIFISILTILVIKASRIYECLYLIFFLIALHSCWEPQLIYLWYNPFLLLIGFVFMRKDEYYLKGKLTKK